MQEEEDEEEEGRQQQQQWLVVLYIVAVMMISIITVTITNIAVIIVCSNCSRSNAAVQVARSPLCHGGLLQGTKYPSLLQTSRMIRIKVQGLEFRG